MRIAVAALLYFSAFGFAYGQGPENTVPAYDHLTGVDLGTAGTSSLENIIISVAVDSQGFIYTLSFGNGVDKRNPDGSMNQEKLIPGNLLQDPLDIEIDSSGNIYIADYFESGSCLDNGKVKIFNSNGDFENEIAYSYFRPLALAIDINDNIYVAEYYDGSTCESEEESRIRVFDSNGILLDQTNSVEIPFRLDVDSKSTLYVSQAGDDNPQVLYFDSNLNFQGTLSNIISPGTVVVDEFDFIHVVEYAGRVDFEKFLNYDELGFLDLLILASNIQEGIDRNEFGFKIFNSNKEFEYYYQDNQIRFPVDITINDHNCNTKLYLNNANINGTSLQFDLEIYERSPSFDLTDPVANCGGDFDLQLVNGSASISVEDVNNGSTDNCGIKDISLSKTTFTETGDFDVVMTVTDNAGNEDTCTVQVTVTGEETNNQPPNAVDDSYTVIENQTLNEAAPGVLINDTDSENDPLTAVLQTDVSNGTLELRPDGSFIYTPDPNYTGSDSFTYAANDGELNSNVVSVSITVTPEPNQAPSAVADSYTVIENQTLNEAAPGVLINDTDPENDPLTAVLQTDVSNGTLELRPNGSFIYTPDPNYTGSDSFTYAANDGELNSNVVSVSITVTPEPNQAPSAVADSYTVIENQTLNEAAPGVLINDTDPENDPLTAVLQTDVSNGTLELRPNGSFIYTPDPNYTGSDSFTYAANDGELNSNVVSVSITVTPEPNQAPSAVADSYTVIENQTLNEAAPGVLINDTDPENDPLTAVLQTDVSNGTLELRPNGSFIYTPDPNYTGSDSFTYAANDGELNSNVVSVNITVTPEPNQAPSAVADSYTVIENQTLNEAAPGVLINDTDPENDPLTAVLQTDVSNGTLELRPDGSFTYTPDPNYTGSDSFTYAANDGELNSIGVSVSITVTPQAEPDFDCPQEDDFEPIIRTDNCEYEAPDYSNSITNFQNFTNTPYVYATYNKNNESLNVTLEVYDGENGEFVGDCVFDVPVLDETAPEILNCDSLNDTVVIEEGGVHQLGNYTEEVEVRDCSSYEVTQEPQSGISINGTTQVTITVTDDTGLTDTCTFTVEVREESEVLDLTCPGSYAVLADENCVYKVPDFSGIATANIDGAVIDQDIEAGSVFQPNSDPYVTVTATFENQSDSCRIYLSPVDEEDPVARCVGDTEIRLAEGETIQLNAEDFDAGSTDNCQVATYNLDRNSLSSADEGENVITLTVNDAAGNLDSCEFTVNVIVEEPGEIDFSCLIVEYKLTPDENCEYFLPDFSEILEYSPAEADFEQSITSGTQLFEDIEVEVTVSYQGESKTCNLYVSLEDQPQAVCRSDFQIQLNEGEIVTIQPEDLDNGSFANCSETSLSLDKTEFTSADLGSNIVTLTVTDEAGNTDSCQTTVNVVLNGSGVNQPPVAIDDEYTTSINTTLEVSTSNGVLVNDTDPENDELTVILQDDVSNGTLDLNEDGSFTYTPDQDFFGQDYFTYIANDGELNSNIIFVSINVEDGTGEFSCVERITLSLNSEGSAELNIEDLYSGNAEGIEFGATERFFSCEDIGENTVTLVYSGRQEGSCEIVVEVIDMSAPVLALNDLEVSLNEAGVATITFNDLDAGSRDNCNGEIIYTLSESAFTCKNLGENEILVTAEDSSGNSSTRTAMVTVLDNEGFCNDFGEGSEYIFIYPNPNTGSFKIATPADVFIERIEVFDHRGRFIAARDYESTATEYPMEVGPLQESVYVVKIVTNERTLTKRFIFKY